MPAPSATLPLPKLRQTVGLLAHSLVLTFRSRRGYLLFLALLRVGAGFIVVVRYALNSTPPRAALGEPAAWLYLAVALAALAAVVVSGHRLDRPLYHRLLIAGDALLISFALIRSGDPHSELYLLYLLPLVAAASFLARAQAGMVAVLILAAYALCLVLLTPAPAAAQLVQLLPLWLPRAAFLVVAVVVYRLQRRLPTPDETSHVAPTQARQELERLLVELRQYVPFQTASIQVLYHKHLQIVACEGWRTPQPVYQIEFPAEDPRYPNAQVIASRSWRIVDTGAFPHFQDGLYHAAHIRTWMGVPLISPITGQIIGLVSIDAAAPNAYSAWHARLAVVFARRIAMALLEAQLGPAALTQWAKREMVRETAKRLAHGLARLRLDEKDDLQLARDFVQLGAEVFSVEDCSLYFLRVKENAQPHRVLHLVASSALPPDEFGNYESPVSGRRGTGLTGYAAHRNQTLNLSAEEIKRSPYHGKVYTQHLRHLRSGRSRQVLIVPLRNGQGEVTGALKVENKIGFTSDNRFQYYDEKLVETLAHVVGTTLESVRRQHYVLRQRRSIHNVSSILSAGLIQPINGALAEGAAGREAITSWAQGARYVASTLHSLLLDVPDNPVLENLGLVPALRAMVASLEQGLPAKRALFERIHFGPQAARDNLPSDVREVFFNIGREALLNVIQHADLLGAPGRRADVAFYVEHDCYVLEVRDNGEGFDPEEQERIPDHFGLPDMEKQAKHLIRGREDVKLLEIDSQPGQGTVVRLTWSTSLASAAGWPAALGDRA